MAVQLSGFADEAADDLEGQISVTTELGWHGIEIRTVGDKNIVDVADKQFSEIRDALELSGIRAHAIGSTIANWGHDLDEPESVAVEAAERAIPRMLSLGAKHIRIMSWKVLCDPSGRAIEDQCEDERVRRLDRVCGMFAQAGLVPVHENCATWGGMSWQHTLRMVAAVPDLKLVFDTGNPPLTSDYTRQWPYPDQSTREFWDQVKNHVAHVHIKDSRRNRETGEEEYCWPGEGDGDVAYVLQDLKSINYDGYLSIEPHMAVVFHDTSVTASADNRRGNYVTYGHKLEKLLSELGIDFTR
jgi:sugar phosphate isomerase/epimerase